MTNQILWPSHAILITQKIIFAVTGICCLYEFIGQMVELYRNRGQLVWYIRNVPVRLSRFGVIALIGGLLVAMPAFLQMIPGSGFELPKIMWWWGSLD
jgi:hypothetical protein